MTFEKYCYVFLKTSDVYKNCLGGNMDIEPYSKKDKRLIYSTINDFESSFEIDNWENSIGTNRGNL